MCGRSGAPARAVLMYRLEHCLQYACSSDARQGHTKSNTHHTSHVTPGVCFRRGMATDAACSAFTAEPGTFVVCQMGGRGIRGNAAAVAVEEHASSVRRWATRDRTCHHRQASRWAGGRRGQCSAATVPCSFATTTPTPLSPRAPTLLQGSSSRTGALSLRMAPRPTAQGVACGAPSSTLGARSCSSRRSRSTSGARMRCVR
jgi:hypothetical protein